MMTVAAARSLPDGAVCFVGIGAPSTAANLARATHSQRLVLVYESGTIGAKPAWLPLSIGDGELADTADSVVSVPEIFNYWLQAGRIDVGFLGAAQIDRLANLNTTVIGDYDDPEVRLPGAGGAPEISASCRQVIVMMRHSRRSFLDRLDLRSSVTPACGPRTPTSPASTGGSRSGSGSSSPGGSPALTAGRSRGSWWRSGRPTPPAATCTSWTSIPPRSIQTSRGRAGA